MASLIKFKLKHCTVFLHYLTSLFEEYGKGKARLPKSQTTMSLPATMHQTRAARRHVHSSRQLSLPPLAEHAETEPLIVESPSPPPPPQNDKELEESSIYHEIVSESRPIGLEKGFVCYCAGVECVFEMILYRYKHKQEREEMDHESVV